MVNILLVDLPRTVEDYSYATENADDGKPGFEERKTCDMMTNIIKVYTSNEFP